MAFGSSNSSSSSSSNNIVRINFNSAIRLLVSMVLLGFFGRGSRSTAFSIPLRTNHAASIGENVNRNRNMEMNMNMNMNVDTNIGVLGRRTAASSSSSSSSSSSLSAEMQTETGTETAGDEHDHGLLEPSAVSSRVFDSDERPVILFDGVCNLCNNAVNLALDWDPSGKLRFSALQSNVGRSLLEANGRSADDISSIVLVTKSDGAFTKSDAVLRIAEELTPAALRAALPLRPAASMARFVVPKALRDAVYDNVADNRYSLMGTRDECRFDADGEFDDRFVDDGLALR